MSTKHITSKDNTKITYHVIGKGPSVILVDGAFCYSGFGPSKDLAALLSKHFTVYYYDRRGRGNSGDDQPYTVDKEIQDIAAIVSEAGGKAHIFGNSSGAVLVMKAAAAGLNLGRLALFEPPFFVGSQKNLPPKDHRKKLKEYTENHEEGKAVTFFLTKIMGVPCILTLLMRLTPNWGKMKAVAKTLQYDSAVMEDFSVPYSLLKSIRQPTIIIGGEKSADVLKKSCEAVAESIPDAELLMLPKQNHNINVKVLAPVLIDFFSKK